MVGIQVIELLVLDGVQLDSEDVVVAVLVALDVGES
jgi:hypothetical protein